MKALKRSLKTSGLKKICSKEVNLESGDSSKDFKHEGRNMGGRKTEIKIYLYKYKLPTMSMIIMYIKMY